MDGQMIKTLKHSGKNNHILGCAGVMYAVHQSPQVFYLLNISSLSSLVSASGSLLFPAHFHLLVNPSNHNHIHLSPTSDLGDDPSLPLLFGNLTACPCVSGFASYFLFTSSHF